jgi:lysozyme family protein
MATFADLKSEYADLWKTMEVRAEKRDAVTAIARKLIALKSIYRKVEARIGVPWFVVAALHNRESGADFNTYLGNGEPLTRRTVLVPKGRGPFASWEEGAIDGLLLKKLDSIADWTAERCCYEIERFNGFGYRNHHPEVKSPYLWSFSNHYRSGKYVADGQFSASAVDKQCGAMPLIKIIMALDSSARLKPDKSAQTAAGGTIVLGGGTAYAAHRAGADPILIAIVIALTLVLALGTFLLMRRKDS